MARTPACSRKLFNINAYDHREGLTTFSCSLNPLRLKNLSTVLYTLQIDRSPRVSVVNLDLKFDGFVKSRHPRENGNPVVM